MKSTPLGNLEKQVMDILWKHKQGSSREVLSQLRGERKLAYTTVATVLQRLFEKGLLSRTEDKAGHIYTPKVTKEEYGKSIAQTFLSRFIDSFGDIAIASFAASVENLPSKKRAYFLKLLDEYENNK